MLCSKCNIEVGKHYFEQYLKIKFHTEQFVKFIFLVFLLMVLED